MTHADVWLRPHHGRVTPSRVSTGGLVPMAILPVQFDVIWARSCATSPTRALALAVIKQAVRDIRDHRCAETRRGQRIHADAHRWIAGDDGEWPYSFANLCALLGLDAGAVRRCVLDGTLAAAPARAGSQPVSERAEKQVA